LECSESRRNFTSTKTKTKTKTTVIKGTGKVNLVEIRLPRTFSALHLQSRCRAHNFFGSLISTRFSRTHTLNWNNCKMSYMRLNHFMIKYIRDPRHTIMLYVFWSYVNYIVGVSPKKKKKINSISNNVIKVQYLCDRKPYYKVSVLRVWKHRRVTWYKSIDEDHDATTETQCTRKLFSQKVNNDDVIPQQSKLDYRRTKLSDWQVDKLKLLLQWL
jgi:hypothetical protein